MGKVISLHQSRSASAESRAYTDRAVGSLAETVLDALTGMESGADLRTLTAGTSGWVKSGDDMCCDIPVAGMTAQTVVFVSVPDASATAAEECGLSWLCESRAGALRIYAEKAPSSAFTLECAMIQPLDSADS